MTQSIKVFANLSRSHLLQCLVVRDISSIFIDTYYIMIAGTAARIFDLTIQRTGFYNRELHVLGEVRLTIACEISKAQNELRFEPRVSLKEGIRRSIQSASDLGVVI